MALSDRGWFSPEVLVEWAGFSAPAVRLQRAGWEFEEIRDLEYHMDGRKRMALRHRKVGWTGYASCPERELMRAVTNDHYRDREFYPIFSVERMSQSANRIELLAGQRMTHHPLDFEPRYREDAIRRFTLAEIFQPEPSEEIIVEPATVMGLLEQIKKMQAPDLARIREENRKRDARDRTDEPREIRHATILSLAA